MGQQPLFMVEILENMENPTVIKTYLEYLNDTKTFAELKKDLKKCDGYHHCILKICYYDEDNKLQEYKEANLKKAPLLIKDSRFKPTKNNNPNTISKKSTIPIVLLNNGDCICQKLIWDQCEKKILEEYKGKESQHKKEIEDLERKRDEAIKALQNLQENEKIRHNTITELNKKVELILKEKEESEKHNKEIMEVIKNMNKEKEDNPNNVKSLQQFTIKKPSINTEIIKKAKETIDTYFDFHLFKETYINDTKKFQGMIDILLEKENYQTKLSKDILKMLKDKPLYKENSKNNTPIKHFNILVLGPSGVGKSTLINSMLLLDENSTGAKTSVGTACTKGKPKEYVSELIEGIRLFDTQGIEMGDYNINAVQKDATELINEKINSGDPDKYIHCIWYCVSETRFHVEEQTCLQVLMNSYHENKIPIIIIYGKAVDEKIKVQMLNEISKFIDKNKSHKLVVIPLLAKKMANVKPFGKNKLLDITVNKLKGALESSCYEGIRKEKLKEFMNEFNNNLLKAEEEEKKEREKKKIKEIIKKDFCDSFISKLSKIINVKFKEDNLGFLASYLYNMFDNLNKEFEKKMDDFVVIYGNQLFNKYYEEYKNLDITNKSDILKLFDTSFLDGAKKTIRDELENEIKNIIIPNNFKEIQNKLMECFKAIINKNFNIIILSNQSILKELQNQVDKLVKDSYDDIYKRIQKCREKNSSQSDFYEDEFEQKKEEKKKEEKVKEHNEFNDIFED